MTSPKSPLFSRVYNRGVAPAAFLAELVQWGRVAPNDIFQITKSKDDIYTKVMPELGYFNSPITRKAVMLEVMRVLAGFESSWDWTEGVDTSRLGKDTPDNAEAGAWQVSFDSRRFVQSFMDAECIVNGVHFQQRTKFNHPFAMEYVARLMRVNTKHNGPLYKGDERMAIRKSLRGAEHSIYPWLKRDCVTEFEKLLSI